MRGARRLAAAAIAGLTLAPPGAGAPVASASGDVDARALERIRNPPLGLPAVPIPAGRAPDKATIALGRKLFFDRRLSRDGTMSCGMCHIPEQGFTSNELATPVGTAGRSLRRNAPTLLNVAYVRQLFHDGRETALETQVILPLLDEREMANASIGQVIERLRRLPDYDGLFERAFGAGPSIDRVGEAIASWERTLLAAASPFDRWRYGGEADAISAQARDGFRLFTGRARCSACHLIGERDATFTDDAFHATGIGFRAADGRGRGPVDVEIAPGVTVALARRAVDTVSGPREPDLGRHEVTGDVDDRWRFRTPGLRNVALTGPYMHDGSLPTLEAVARFYAAGGVSYPGLDPLIRPLDLGERDIAALVAFLESLTGENVEALVEDARSVGVGNRGMRETVQPGGRG